MEDEVDLASVMIERGFTQLCYHTDRCRCSGVDIEKVAFLYHYGLFIWPLNFKTWMKVLQAVDPQHILLEGA